MEKLDFDDLQLRKRYRGAYGKSKLANVLFAYELAHKLRGTGVTVNAAAPGLVATDIGKSEGGFAAFGKGLVDRLMGQTPEGAETSIYLASSPEVEGITGKYFKKKQPVPSSRYSHSKQAAKRLWEISEKLTSSQ